MTEYKTRFVERISDGVKKALEKVGVREPMPTSPDRVDKQLKAILRTLVAHGPNGKIENLAVAEVKTLYDGHIAPFMGAYRHAYSVVEEINRLRRHEDWADSVDRWKLLLFRVATTICIAAVILGTSYLANRWGIPLPLLRLAP